MKFLKISVNRAKRSTKFIYKKSPKNVNRSTDGDVDSLADKIQARKEALKKSGRELKDLQDLITSKELTVTTKKGRLMVRDPKNTERYIGRLVKNEKVKFLEFVEDPTQDSSGNETGEKSKTRDHLWVKVEFSQVTYFDSKGRKKRYKRPRKTEGIVSLEYLQGMLREQEEETETVERVVTVEGKITTTKAAAPAEPKAAAAPTAPKAAAATKTKQPLLSAALYKPDLPPAEKDKNGIIKGSAMAIATLGSSLFVKANPNREIDAISHWVQQLESYDPEKQVMSVSDWEKISKLGEGVLKKKGRDMNGLSLWRQYTQTAAGQRNNEFFHSTWNPLDNEAEDEALIKDAKEYGSMSQMLEFMVQSNDPTIKTVEDAIAKLKKEDSNNTELETKLEEFLVKYNEFKKELNLPTGTLDEVGIEDLDKSVDKARLEIAERLVEEGAYKKAAEIYQSVFMKNGKIKELIKDIKTKDIKDELKRARKDLPTQEDVLTEIKKDKDLVKNLETESKKNQKIVISAPDGSSKTEYDSVNTALNGLKDQNYKMLDDQVKNEVKSKQALNEESWFGLFKSNKFKAGALGLTDVQAKAIKGYQDIHGLGKNHDLAESNKDWWKTQIAINIPLMIATSGVGFLAARGTAFLAGRALAVIDAGGRTTSAAIRGAAYMLGGGQGMMQSQHLIMRGELINPLEHKREWASATAMFGLMALNPGARLTSRAGKIESSIQKTGIKAFASRGLDKAALSYSAMGKSTFGKIMQIPALAGVEAAAFNAVDMVIAGDDRPDKFTRFLETWATLAIMHGMQKGYSPAKARIKSIPVIRRLKLNMLKKSRAKKDFLIYLESKIGSKNLHEIAQINYFKKQINSLKTKYPKIDQPSVYAKGKAAITSIGKKIPQIPQLRNVKLSNKTYFDGGTAKIFTTLKKGQKITVKPETKPQSFNIPGSAEKITLSSADVKIGTTIVAGTGNRKIGGVKVTRQKNGNIIFEKV